MPNVKVVIGANFGDEGKGLMTDYFCAEAIKENKSCIVALCNGGAQRGHTVVTPDGVRHVFHHFGSGTLVGAATYLSKDYILNPMTFRKEYEELEDMGFIPTVYAHPLCRWSTPYDMIVNQILEDSRGDKRHGSCGMGIWETIQRYKSCFGSPCIELFDNLNLESKTSSLMYQREYLRARIIDVNPRIIESWNDIINSDELLNKFIEDIKFMRSHIVWVGNYALSNFDTVVFENGQGLLLDQNRTEYGDNTTPSNTGIKNPREIIRQYFSDADVEVCYVTRTYLTRHGAGRFDEECDKNEINPFMEDKTNVPNPYQGSIRYGKLDASALLQRIKDDVSSIRNNNYKISLAITHMNEYENKELLSQAQFERVYLSYNETRNMVVI